MITLESLAAELQSLKSVLIATHISPDSDAIGSSFGLALGLSSLGIEATVYLPGPIPNRLAKLAIGVSVIHQIPNQKFSAVIGVDTATKARLGDDHLKLLQSALKTYNIDHHHSNELWADLNYVEEKTAATAQIVFFLLKQMKAKLDPRLVNLLFAGLLEDTGSFRFGNTNAKSLETAYLLVQAGAQPEFVSNILYFNVPHRVWRLRAKVLNALQLLLDGKVALINISLALLKETGSQAEDTDGLIDEARQLEGVVCAVMIRELEDGFKVSLRSKSENLDVSAIAATFGGGGHKAAAGFKVKGTQDQVEKLLLEQLKTVL